MANLAALRALRAKLRDPEQPILREAVLREAVTALSGAATDPDAGHSDFAWYRKTGQARRDWNVSTRREAVERAVTFLYTHPLANRYVSLMLDWMRPAEFVPVAEDEKVQAVVQRFWTDPRNDWRNLMPKLARAKIVLGELVLPALVDPVTADVVFDYWDPGDVESVAFKPGSNRAPLALLYKPANASASIPVPIIRAVPQAAGPARLQGADLAQAAVPGTVAGALWFPFNALPNMTRGVGNYFASLDYWVRHQDFIEAKIEQAQMLSRFMGDVTVEGAQSQDEIDKAREPYMRTPQFASLPWHAETQKWNLAAVPLHAGDAAEMERMIRVLASAPTGTPPHILAGDMTEGNRAIAKDTTDPMYMRAAAERDELAFVVQTACQYAVDVAYAMRPGEFAGVEDWGIRIETPSLLKKSPAEAAPVLGQVASALTILAAERFLDRGTCRRVAVSAVREFGLEDVTVEMVEEALEAESAAVDAAARQQLARVAATLDEPEPGPDESEPDESEGAGG